MTEPDPYLHPLAAIAVQLKRIADELEGRRKASNPISAVSARNHPDELADRIRDLEIVVTGLGNRPTQDLYDDLRKDKSELLARARSAEAIVAQTISPTIREVAQEIVDVLTTQGVTLTGLEDNGLIAVTGYLNPLALARSLVRARYIRVTGQPEPKS